MSEREKRKAEWRLQSLARKDQMHLEQSLRKILLMPVEQRSEYQLALLMQHKDLAAQISNSMEASKRRKQMQAEYEKEVEDPLEVLEPKLRQLADLMKSSDQTVFHTGAGLSTAAGIPDFRGPQGVWTLQKKGQVAGMRMRYEEARPTRAHMAIAEMVRRGLVRHVVTQNVDGLLLRAGVPPDRLSELHGCVYTERCPSCGRSYLRGYDVTAANGTSFRRHSTGRTCDGLAPATSAEMMGPAAEASGTLINGKSALDGELTALTGEEKGRGRRGEEGDRQRVPSGKGSERPAKAAAQHSEDGCVRRADEGSDTGPETTLAERAADFVIKGANGTQATDDGNEQSFGGCERRCKTEPGGSAARGRISKETGGREENGDRGNKTGPEVEQCGAQLRDTIVHFGERLDERTLRTAREASEGADLAVVLGSSLKIPPASTLPGRAKKVVIINLQWTAKDKKAALKINGRCEDVMMKLSRLLIIAVPEYDVRKDPILCKEQSKSALPSGALQEKSATDEGGAIAEKANLRKGSGRQKKSRARAAFPRPVL